MTYALLYLLFAALFYGWSVVKVPDMEKYTPKFRVKVWAFWPVVLVAMLYLVIKGDT